MKRILTVASTAALIASGPAVAELVYFAKGGQAQLPATVDGGLVRLDTPDGPKTFPRADFAAIVAGSNPLDEWTARRDLANKAGSLEARFAAAWWALENGLTDRAIASLDELRPVAAISSPAGRAIAAIDRLSLPCPEPDLADLKARLNPLRFREARSPHAVLLHQLGEAEARERLDLIEWVVTTFHVAFAAQGLELPGPGRRLVSVYFAEHRDYLKTVRRIDGDAFAETQGFYHPVLRAVFAFDARSTDAQRAGRRAVANRKVAGDPESELSRRSLLLDLEWRGTDLGILAHETIHQLTTECGLAPRFDDFPTWLHEGLAAQFEVIRGGRWAGFGRLNDQRLPDWRSIHPAPRLAPLLHDAGFGHGYRREVYAESWALVYYLRKARPHEFLAFLDLLRAPRTESTARPDRAFEAFRAAFGEDLPGIESDWRRFLADFKTPLEEGRPNGR
jgi:hypothetical protein